MADDTESLMEKPPEPPPPPPTPCPNGPTTPPPAPPLPTQASNATTKLADGVYVPFEENVCRCTVAMGEVLAKKADSAAWTNAVVANRLELSPDGAVTPTRLG